MFVQIVIDLETAGWRRKTGVWDNFLYSSSLPLSHPTPDMKPDEKTLIVIDLRTGSGTARKDFSHNLERYFDLKFHCIFLYTFLYHLL